jgi:CPA2 family monovalent cation:H+ antiporter-2
MLFDPLVLMNSPVPLLATVLIIIIGKSVAAFVIVRLFGHPKETAAMISASLAQIGEFSFIMAGLGITLGLMPSEGRDLILAGALISIMLNPLCFALVDHWAANKSAAGPARTPAEMPVETQAKPVVLVGFGRVGNAIREALRDKTTALVVIEEREELTSGLAGEPHVSVISGNAVEDDVLAQAELPRAGWLFVTAPDAFESGQIIEQAKKLNPGITVIARAHSDAEVEHLKHYGADHVIMGERQIAEAMVQTMAGNAI